MHSRRGFTLIEVLVALTIGGFVVLAAHQTFGAATDAARGLAEAREMHEIDMRARRFLTVTFASLDVVSPGSTGFHGLPGAAAFSTLNEGAIELRMTDGWLVARRGGSAGAVVPLLPADRVTFDYLLHAGANEAWVREWRSPVSAPLAVRVRLVRPGAAAVDTMLFAIGSRG